MYICILIRRIEPKPEVCATLAERCYCWRDFVTIRLQPNQFDSFLVDSSHLFCQGFSCKHQRDVEDRARLSFYLWEPFQPFGERWRIVGKHYKTTGLEDSAQFIKRSRKKTHVQESLRQNVLSFVSVIKMVVTSVQNIAVIMV